MNVRELVIKMVLDSSGAKKGLDQTQQSMDDVSKAAGRVEKEAKDAGKALVDAGQQGQSAWQGLAGFIKGFATIGTAVSSALNYKETVDGIKSCSDALGMNMETLQGWEGAAKEAGAEAEDMRDLFYDVSDWVSDLAANDSGPLKDLADKTGMAFKDASGKMLPVEESLLRISEAVEKMSPEEGAGYLKRLGVDNKLIGMLLKGRKGLEEVTKAYKDLAIYKDEDDKVTKSMAKIWGNLTSAFQSVVAIIMRALGPALQWLAQKTEAVFTWMAANGDSVKVVLTALAAVFGVLLVPKVLAFAKAMGVLISPMGAAIAIFTAIVLAIDDFITYLQGGESALADFWAMFGTPEEINAALDAVKEFAQTVGETLMSAWESVKQVVSATLDLFQGFFTGNWDACINALSKLADGFSNLGGIIGGVLDWIKGKLMGLLPDWMVGFLSGGGGGGSAPAAQAPAAPSGASASAGALAGADAGAIPSSNVREAVGSGGFGTKDMGKSNQNVTNNNQKSVTQTFNNNITVNSQATDAQGVAKDIGPALRQNQTAQADAAFGA